jgi:hypothetical protein
MALVQNIMHVRKNFLRLIITIIIIGPFGRCSADIGVRPLSLKNFRRLGSDMFGSSFTWGKGSQLIYSSMCESGHRLYLHDLDTGRIDFISKGRSPVFREFQDHSVIYFLKSTGYSDKKEFWQFFIYPNNCGESKVSSATIRASSNIYPSPWNVRVFAYRYSCCMAEGGFEQIRLTEVKGYDKTYNKTMILCRPGGNLPSIAGWLDRKHLICFVNDEPCILRTDHGIELSVTHANQDKLNTYPEEDSGLLTKGLHGYNRIILPSSNFTPDGRTYIVYSDKCNALVQRTLDGTDITSIYLPDLIEYKEYNHEHPKFSRDGRHICFVGLAKKANGQKRVTLWIADVNR